MEFQYVVVYENGSNKVDIGHCWIKGKVTVGLQKFTHLLVMLECFYTFLESV